MSLSTQQLEAILNKLNDFSSSAADFIISLLKNAELTDNTPVEEMAQRLDEILGAMKQNKDTSPQLLKWANEHVQSTYASEILTLVRTTQGFHFGARKATAAELGAIDIDTIASNMRELAPELWDLLGLLLLADPVSNERRTRAREKRQEKKKEAKERAAKATAKDRDGDVTMASIEPENLESANKDADEEDYWEDMADPADIFNDQSGEESEEEEEGLKNSAAEREKALITIVRLLHPVSRSSKLNSGQKKVVCISVMMHSTNQRCNSLQTLLGIFLHACNAPQTVVELMAHLGVSISTTAINHAVDSVVDIGYTHVYDLQVAYSYFQNLLFDSLPFISRS